MIGRALLFWSLIFLTDLLTYEGNQTIPYQLRNIFAARL